VGIQELAVFSAPQRLRERISSFRSWPMANGGKRPVKPGAAEAGQVAIPKIQQEPR
jgi:hypothetical protein